MKPRLTEALKAERKSGAEFTLDILLRVNYQIKMSRV